MFEWVCEQAESVLGDVVGEHACAVVISLFVVLGTVLCIIYFRNKPVYLYGRSSTRVTDTGVSPGRSSSRSKQRRRRTSRRRKYYYY